MTLSSLVLADMSLTAVLWWIVVGLIAGFLARLVGLGASGFIGTIIVAFIGACILIAILRAVAGTTGRQRTLYADWYMVKLL